MEFLTLNQKMTLDFVKAILIFSIPKCIFSSLKNITNMFSDATTF